MGANGTQPHGVNDAGQIAGTAFGATVRGFVTAPGGTGGTEIAVPGSTGVQALGLNNAGQVVGSSTMGATPQGQVPSSGYIYAAGAVTRLDFPGAFATEAWGINDAGQVVGTYRYDGYTSRAFLYDAGTFTDFSVPGSTVTEAFGINDAGQVVGVYSGATGDHAFLATPVAAAAVPEPASLLLLGAGLASVGAARRRARG